MNEAEQIQVEVARLSDMQNGVIVAEHLMADSATCRCCQFVEDREKFIWLLRQYTHTKISAHIWKRRFYGEREDGVYFATSNSEREKSWIEFQFQSQMYRFELDRMNPCFRCRLKYNPTDKSKFMGHRFWGWDGTTFVERKGQPQTMSHSHNAAGHELADQLNKWSPGNPYRMPVQENFPSTFRDGETE